MKDHAQILIVEDEALVAEDIKAHIEEMGHAVSSIVSNGEDALTLLQGSRPDLVLMDIVLTGEVDGIDVAEVINEKYHIPVIYLTAYTDKDKLERAQKTAPYGYLVKPFDERELRTTINVALYKATLDHQLRENKRWAYAVLNSVEDGVITTDRSGRVHFMNPKAQLLTGTSIDEATNRRLTEIINFEDPAQQTDFEHAIILLLEQGRLDNSHIEGMLQQRNSASLPVEANISTINSEASSNDGIIFSFRDVTLQYQARQKLDQYNEELARLVGERTESLNKSNAELEQARNQALAASKAKGDFITTMSHELRTPLNPIIGYTQLLLDSKQLDTEQAQFVEEIKHSARILLEHINDILTLTEGRKQDQKIFYKPFDVINLLNQITPKFEKYAGEKGLDFRLELPAHSPETLLGDTANIERVLQKLLDNALKFTARGGITLRLEADTGELPDQTRLLFKVNDTGIGIDTTKVTDLFTPFHQVDSSMSRSYNGMGIGLALCKLLVEGMGGNIGVDSQTGNGSSFWFELSLQRIDA